MRLASLTLAAILALSVAACSKKSDSPARTAADPVAANAAADASSVTSIPGYTPQTGNARP